MQHASDTDEHFAKVPRASKPRSAVAQPLGKLGAEFPAPVSDAVVGDHNAALGQGLLDITQAEAEPVMQPHGMADDIGREAMAPIQT